jgi:hypothetical protein
MPAWVWQHRRYRILDELALFPAIYRGGSVLSNALTLHQSLASKRW